MHRDLHRVKLCRSLAVWLTGLNSQLLVHKAALCFIYTAPQLTGNLIQFYRLPKSRLFRVQVKSFP